MPTLRRRLGPARSAARAVRAIRPAGAVLASALAVAVVVAACAGAGTSEPSVSFDPNAPTLLAHGLMFDKTELDVPANRAFELVLQNEDGVPHNISIYSDEGHTQVVFRGDLVNTGTHVYQVQALAPGTYYFQCDVHPQMHGVVIAAPG